MILFGGVELPEGGKWIEPAFVAEWDGKRWEKKDAYGPCGRRGHGFVYHAKDKKAYLIGGVTQAPNGTDSTLFDMWTWDGVTWKKLRDECPLKEVQAVYNSTTTSIIARGGKSENIRSGSSDMPGLVELWEFKNNHWKKLAGGGPTIDGPYQMVYDEKRKSVMAPSWENGRAIMWKWSVGKWTALLSSDTITPEIRNRYSLAYVRGENKVYMFGGRNSSRNFINDLWEWDGNRWKQIIVPYMPAARASHNAITVDDTMIIYGGSGEKGKLLNEIWTWKEDRWSHDF